MKQSLLTSISTVAACILLAFFAVDKFCLLREEYVMQAIIIEKDKEFYSKCQTPEGYASMNHHPNFCEKIIATARTGAFWHAVRKVAGSLPIDEAVHRLESVSWKVLIVLALGFLFVPSLFIRHSRSKHDVIPYYYKPVVEQQPYYCKQPSSDNHI
jgi:hypothetical protein